MEAAINVMEHCRIAPQLEKEKVAGEEASLPLTFFDMMWLDFHSVHRLIFFEFPHSRDYFINTTIPHLKNSLSLALNHYLPLAGNLIYPLKTHDSEPEIRYKAGDSVPLIFAEATTAGDFSYLTGNHARDADAFYPLVPQMPPETFEDSSDSRVTPLLALQVTLFPGVGLSVGITNHHVVGDASSTIGFINSWCSITKFGIGGDQQLQSRRLPFYDRSVIKDPCGLAQLFYNEMKKLDEEMVGSHSVTPPVNKARATFIMSKANIQRLKDSFLAAHEPTTTTVDNNYVSAFTVTCAYVWACLVKAKASLGEKAAKEELETEYFVYAADCRARLNPPVPATYFGNCLAPCIATVAHGQLVSKEGFIIAAMAIREAIKKRVQNKDGILKNAEAWVSELASMNTKRLLGVAGSPKFDHYEADYGWGKPKKFESLSIDSDASMSLSRSRESAEELEVGLSLSISEMDAFAALFTDSLQNF